LGYSDIPKSEHFWQHTDRAEFISIFGACPVGIGSAHAQVHRWLNEILTMPNVAKTRWPHFELVRFPQPTGIPNGWDDELVRKGVPKSIIGRMYQAASTLTLLDDPRYGQLVCFASCGGFCSICLGPRTGQIIAVITVPSGPAWLVNSSLDAFIETVQVVIQRFPFYSQDNYESEKCDLVADELAHIIQRADPVALVMDGFWQTFVDNVRIGDFSTEDVLS
jgi:hypothetical protein